MTVLLLASLVTCLKRSAAILEYKLLSLLYRLVFADALGSVDGDLSNMEDFFTSEEPPPATAAMNGDTAPANEVIDVWAS